MGLGGLDGILLRSLVQLEHLAVLKMTDGWTIGGISTTDISFCTFYIQLFNFASPALLRASSVHQNV